MKKWNAKMIVMMSVAAISMISSAGFMAIEGATTKGKESTSPGQFHVMSTEAQPVIATFDDSCVHFIEQNGNIDEKLNQPIGCCDAYFYHRAYNRSECRNESLKADIDKIVHKNCSAGYRQALLCEKWG